MSKTYFSRNEYWRAIEQEQQYEDEFAEIHNCGKPKTNDFTDEENRKQWHNYSSLTRGLAETVHQYNFSRHPNGPKGRGLSHDIEHHEYHRRFGDCYDRSDRCRLWKKCGRKERRAIQKRITQKMIDEVIK